MSSACWRCSASDSPRSSGCRAITSCGRTAGIRCDCAARRATCIWSRRAVAWASSRRRIPYPVWPGEGGPLLIVPLFVLYDYSFRPDGAASIGDGLARARAAGVVSSDERLLHPDPYPSRRSVVRRPDCEDGRTARQRCRRGCRPCWSITFPLVREPTAVMRYPEFAQWCGTVRTADWPIRFGASRGGLRPPAHSADDVARRRPARGGVARLPPRVEAAGQRARHPAPDPARSRSRQRTSRARLPQVQRGLPPGSPPTRSGLLGDVDFSRSPSSAPSTSRTRSADRSPRKADAVRLGIVLQ